MDASTEILTRVTDFCQHLTATVNGLDVVTDEAISATDGKTFVQQNRATYLVFKRKIRTTAPDFRAFEDHENYMNPLYSDCDKSDDETPSTSTKTCGPYNLYDVRRVIKRFVFIIFMANVFSLSNSTIVLLLGSFRTMFPSMRNDNSSVISHAFGMHLPTFALRTSPLGYNGILARASNCISIASPNFSRT